MRTILAILLLCATASAEDTFTGNWSRVRYDYSGLEVAAESAPQFSIWHIDGHGYQWERDQLDSGQPLYPTVRMISAALRDGGAIVNGVPKQIGILNGNAPLLSQLSGGPITLRMNNILTEIDDTLPRIEPLTEENWQQSILCVKNNPDGTPNQTPIPDPFGPLYQWEEVGRLWATGAWMVRLQEIIPNPTEITHRENNEGGRQKFKQLRVGGTGPWKTRTDLLTFSRRAADWVDARRHLNPADCESEYVAEENARYHALYAAFRANLCPEWQSVPFRTVGYKGFDENRQNDTASPPFYPGNPGNQANYPLTSPRHEQNIAALQPEWASAGWRELSVCLFAQGITQGYDAGQHDVVDPENWAGFLTAMSWRMQSPGQDVRLVWWDNSNTTPGTVLAAQKPDVQNRLIAIGRSDVAYATVEDFELAVMGQLKRIHDHPTINRYWREGTTQILTCPLNDVTVNPVYATETTLPGVEQTLLCVYTPRSLSGEIQVGQYAVPAKRFAYYLTGSVVEIE